MKSNTRRLVELLFREGETNSGIGRKVGMHRDTVRRWRSKLVLSELTQELVAQMSEEDLRKRLARSSRKDVGCILPDYDELLAELSKPGKTKMHLYGKYLEQAVSVQTDLLRPVGRSKFYSELRGREKARGLEFRHVYQPGEVMQFDFVGKRPFYVDNYGEKCFAEVAVSVLPFSNMTFAVAIQSQNQRDSITSVVKTIDYFGAIPSDIIIDNFKAAVTRPKSANRPAIINRHFRGALDHYGIVPDPTYVARPRHKGAGENAVKIVTTEFVGSEKFLGCGSLEELNQRLREVIDDLNNRPMPTYNGRSRREIYEADEKPHMPPLEIPTYEFGEWSEEVTVPLHYYVRSNGTEYSVPYRYVGQKVSIKTTATMVEIYASGDLIAAHGVAKEGLRRVTMPEHLPTNHLVMHEEDHGCILERARRMGDIVHDFVDMHIEQHGNKKAASAMCRQFERKLRLHGRDTFFAAIKEAIDRRQIFAPAVYALLERQPQHGNEGELPLSPKPTGNVRGSGYYNNQGKT